jgi:uncharacterized protein YbbC (DUF1343 family)
LAIQFPWVLFPQYVEGMNYHNLLKHSAIKNLASSNAGLLCNHTAWDFETGSYLFQKIPGLKRVFVPEHGLFAELQDQVPLTDNSRYADFGIDAQMISLYGGSEQNLHVSQEHLEDLEVLFIDLQDVGSRYFTYAVTASYLIRSVARHTPDLPLIIIDRDNPAGIQVEGSKLPEEYSSFIGHTGLPHRHGLTMAELILFFYDYNQAAFPVSIVTLPGVNIRPDFSTAFPEKIELISPLYEPNQTKKHHNFDIPPSPNIPHPNTPLVYSGQCLLEGTNLSEGRGTTRPFELFGAPWLTPLRRLTGNMEFMKCPGAILRPLRFIPTFHKWKDEICEGFQIHLTGEPYHSLMHSLMMIRAIKENFPDSFSFREGPYEFGSEKSAIKMLCGDPVLLGYLDGIVRFENLEKYLRETEMNWLDEMKKYKIYDRTNISLLQ